MVKHAGLTKRTLYQYFQSKEDLFYAVALKGARQLYEASINALRLGENTREKIRLANLAHLTFFRDYPDLFRILNYLPANRQNIEASPHYQEIRHLDAARMEYLGSLAIAGASDSSINPNLDMKKAVFFGFFLPSASFIPPASWTKASGTHCRLMRESFWSSVLIYLRTL